MNFSTLGIGKRWHLYTILLLELSQNFHNIQRVEWQKILLATSQWWSLWTSIQFHVNSPYLNTHLARVFRETSLTPLTVIMLQLHLRQSPMLMYCRASVLTVPADKKSILKLVAVTDSGRRRSNSAMSMCCGVSAFQVCFETIYLFSWLSSSVLTHTSILIIL